MKIRSKKMTGVDARMTVIEMQGKGSEWIPEHYPANLSG